MNTFRYDVKIVYTHFFLAICDEHIVFCEKISEAGDLQPKLKSCLEMRECFELSCISKFHYIPTETFFQYLIKGRVETR